MLIHNYHSIWTKLFARGQVQASEIRLLCRGCERCQWAGLPVLETEFSGHQRMVVEGKGLNEGDVSGLRVCFIGS